MQSQLTLSHSVSASAKPILKWAGGKTQLLKHLRAAVPKQFNRYIEPFLGGGALFFDLALPGSLVADSNDGLIETYEVVRDTPNDLLNALASMAVNKDEYYRWRSTDPQTLDKVTRAARFVYLNKSCYNGLHRVNRKGQFNTPFGGRSDIKIIDQDNMYKVSSILKTADLRCASFEKMLSLAEHGDLVYLDPPYLPLGGYSDFRRYTKDFFGAHDHFRLASQFRRLSDKGVFVLLSNSDSPVIEDLYQGYHQRRVKASRQINCRANGRGQITELLVANYAIEISDVFP